MSKVEDHKSKQVYVINKKEYVELTWARDMQRAIKRVRELHHPVNDGGCGDPDCCSPADSEEFCIICNGYEYPCETIKTLDGK